MTRREAFHAIDDHLLRDEPPSATLNIELQYDTFACRNAGHERASVGARNRTHAHHAIACIENRCSFQCLALSSPRFTDTVQRAATRHFAQRQCTRCCIANQLQRNELIKLSQ